MARANQFSKAAAPSGRNIKRQLSDCYQRGLHLATREKAYDYAHAMFAECVLHEPGNLQFVEAMVQNLRARTPKGKKSLFNLRRGGSRALKKPLQRKDWTGVLRTGVELLKGDPWNVATLRAMAEACAALHQNEVELVYLKQALDSEPKNMEVNRHCARSLGRMGQFDQAIACWHRVEKLAGKDQEAARMISVLTEEKLKYPGGRPPAAQSKQTTVEVEEPEHEHAPRDVVLSFQQQLEQAIAQDPQNAGNYLELTELLLVSNQFNAAETVLSRAIAACGEQGALVDQLNRVRILRADEQRGLDEKRALEQQIADAPIRIPWMELALGSAMVLLVLQLVPSVRAAAWKVVDVSQWSQFGWIVFNVLVILGLITARFAPDIRAFMGRKPRRRNTG